MKLSKVVIWAGLILAWIILNFLGFSEAADWLSSGNSIVASIGFIAITALILIDVISIYYFQRAIRKLEKKKKKKK